LFFGEEKGDGKYQTWCLKEDWVRKGLTVAERRDNIGLKEWRKFAYVRRRDDSRFGDINREQKRKGDNWWEEEKDNWREVRLLSVEGRK